MVKRSLLRDRRQLIRLDRNAPAPSLQRLPAEGQQRLCPHGEIDERVGELRGSDQLGGERFLDDQGFQPDGALERSSLEFLETARNPGQLIVVAEGEPALLE